MHTAHCVSIWIACIISGKGMLVLVYIHCTSALGWIPLDINCTSKINLQNLQVHCVSIATHNACIW